MIFNDKIDESLFLIAKINDKESLNIYKIVNNIPNSIKEEISNNLNNIENNETISSIFENNNYLSYKYTIENKKGIKVLTIIEYYKNNNSNKSLIFNFGFSLFSYNNKSIWDINDYDLIPIGKVKHIKNNKLHEFYYNLKSDSTEFVVSKQYKEKRIITKKEKILKKAEIAHDVKINDIYVKTLTKR